MKVVVTGASGFIGRHVLAELSHRQVDVVAVTRDAKRLHNIPDGICIVEQDIAFPDKDTFYQLGCPDVLIHLAWDGLPNYKSLHHFETELPKHYNFLKNLLEAGLPSLFVAGTCFEYGMQSGELSEKVSPCPLNPYSYAKDALHKQLLFLKSLDKFKLTWGRLFYMYGDGQAVTSLYSQFKETVLQREKTFNMSGGEQLRDYLTVQDVAKYIVQLSLYCSDAGTLNICSGRPISVRTLVEHWMNENNGECKLNLGYYPYPDYEPMAFWGDATKLNTTLRSSE